MFNSGLVVFEYLELILVVTLKVIVQGFPANFTAHALVAVFPPKTHYHAVGQINWLRLRKIQTALIGHAQHAEDIQHG